MSSLETTKTIEHQTEAIQTTWNKLRAELEQEKAQLYDQLGHYPTPITACDQQFNYLLDRQARVVQALARLSEAEQASLTAADPARVMAEFIRTSPHIDHKPH